MIYRWVERRDDIFSTHSRNLGESHYQAQRLNESTSLIESRLKLGPLLELGRGDNYARLQLQRDTAKKYA